jgi:hypothetical protein
MPYTGQLYERFLSFAKIRSPWQNADVERVIGHAVTFMGKSSRDGGMLLAIALRISPSVHWRGRPPRSYL